MKFYRNLFLLNSIILSIFKCTHILLLELIRYEICHLSMSWIHSWITSYKALLHSMYSIRNKNYSIQLSTVIPLRIIYLGKTSKIQLWNFYHLSRIWLEKSPEELFFNLVLFVDNFFFIYDIFYIGFTYFLMYLLWTWRTFILFLNVLFVFETFLIVKYYL